MIIESHFELFITYKIRRELSKVLDSYIIMALDVHFTENFGTYLIELVLAETLTNKIQERQ